MVVRMKPLWKVVQPTVVGTINGYAATTTPDKYGEILFNKEGLERLQKGVLEKPFVYLEHDVSRPPVGKITKAKVVNLRDYFALEVEIEIYDENALRMVKEGSLKGLSISGVRQK